MPEPAGHARRVARGPSLRVRYLVALSLIAILTVPSQAVIQFQLADASTDATLINFAGRQRMLSQRINHLAASAIFATDLADREAAMSRLENTVAAWVAAHHTLANGGPESVSNRNYSPALRSAYRELDPLVRQIADNAYHLAVPHHQESAVLHLAQLHGLTERFLPLMHGAVDLHEAQADARVTRLKQIELALLIGTLLLLLLEALFVFEPAAIALRRQRRELDRRAEELAQAVHVAERASGVKSAFLANMSHEIRTPLTAVIGSVELLNAPRDDEERADLIRAIAHNAEHLLDLVNDVLDLAKIEAGQLTTEKTRVSPIELVAQVDAIVRPNASAKGLGLDIAFASPVPDRLLLDATRTRQVLINVIGNAVKFTEAGGITLTCGCDSGPSSAELWFEVRDTGIGIAPDRVGAVFNAFEQADRSTTRRYGGTGLGLTVSRTLAHAMHGDLVVVRSTPGEGTTFRFTLRAGSIPSAAMLADPAARLEELRHANPRFDEPAPGPADPLVGRVLIAEDSPENRKLLRYFLKRTELDATFVSDGLEAVRVVDAHAAHGSAFDAVLMDMQMPVMDGQAAVRAIRAAGHGVPIIAFTANVAVEDRERFFEAGCTDFLAKPVKPDAFLDAIRRGIAGQSSASAAARAA